MKVSTVRIFIVLLFALGACSGEDQQPPQTPPPKVVQPIKPSTADIEKPTTTPAEEKKPPAEEKASTEKAAPSPDKPGTAPKPAAEEKKAASEKKDQDEPRTYVVKKGDTLSSIAARSDVLKDPLKWPILLRLNRDKLGEWAAGEDLPDRELPQGTELKVITAREARASFKKASGTLWVANVLSATTNAEIVPPAVTLVKQGYPVYIVRASVKGKDYMRLRVGFFKNRSEADEVGKKIKEQLNFQDSWSTKVDKEEYEEVAGFLKSIEKH
jgi:LysM repeat protein